MKGHATGAEKGTPGGTAGKASGQSGIEHALRERVKELTCLYGVARLAEQGTGSVEPFLKGVVELLPPAWQFPEVTRADVTYRGRRFVSPMAVASVYAEQSAPIRIADEVVGMIRVVYVERCPAAFEGPFLREERALIDGLAEYVATIGRRIEAEAKVVEANRLLNLEREALRESNGALRTVLARIGDERQELCRDLQANVEKVLLPVIQAISMELPPPKRAYATLLRNSLLDITSPLTRGLTSLAPLLTPAETSVCTMIRNGLRTKEIARLRGISAATVNRHREHIRRKLGLANQAVNLTTWLQNHGAETG
jgi:DNA-binding CsgD family transcriptional regulator